MSHTPAPWKVVPKPKGTFGKDWIEIHGPERGSWVVMPGSFDVQRDEERWTESGVRIRPEDAHLIAAAPDLLAALRNLVLDIQSEGGHHEIVGGYISGEHWARAVAAVAKFEGEAAI